MAAGGFRGCVDPTIGTCLQILHAHEAYIGELSVAAVVDLNGRNVVFARRDGESLREVMLVDEVGNQERGATLLEGVGEIAESYSDIRQPPLWLEVEEL